MIDNLTEAIAHAREVAEKQRGYTEALGSKPVTEAAKTYVNACLECAKDHEQLVAWLEELKCLRKENQELRDTILSESYRWIPVSERLPEQTTAYIVTIKFIEDYEECIMTDTVIYNIKYGWNTADEVIAWKPMPKPYEPKEESETENESETLHL